MEAKNVDDVLVASMNNSQPPPQPAVEVSQPVNDPIQPQEAAETVEVVEKIEPTISKEDSPIDEYGNPVEKTKVYTEDEVNKLIRDRLSRGKYAEQSAPQPQVQPQPEQQQQEEDWRESLKKEVKAINNELQQENNEQQWRQQELVRQAEFEQKFTTGMNKYNDFHQVISGKPITDTMMLATRNLENPAAFIYGAAKFHAQDLERIAKISDPYAQAAEVGRLHEKMIKTKNVMSSAPKPLEAVSGDIPQKNLGNMPSLEERIHQYAKQKRK